MANNRPAPVGAAANPRPVLAPRPPPLPEVAPGAKVLLDHIAVAEGTDEIKARRHGYGSGYDVIYGYRHSDTPISEMTLDQLDQFQSMLGEHTPVGRYQIVRSTLQALRREFCLAGQECFTPELQDQLGRKLLSWSGYDQSRLSPAQVQQRFARQWASIPDLSGDSVDPEQPVGTSGAGFLEALAMARRLDAVAARSG